MDAKKSKLTQLDSSEAEEFIEALYRHSSEKLSGIITCFTLRAPQCLYEMTGREATKVIAYGPGARTKNGITNAAPITIEAVRQEIIDETIAKLFNEDQDVSEAEKLEKAKEHIWPAASRGVREKDRGAFNRDADALFAYAEGRMNPDIRMILNTDENYQEAKSNRCVIGFLENLRAKCAVGTTNAQANREALETKLRGLYMEGKLESYPEFKNSFIRIVNSLRKCIEPGDFNEGEYILKFLSKIDQDIFGEPTYKRVGPADQVTIRNANTLEGIFQAVDEIFDAKKTVHLMTKRLKSEHSSDVSQAKPQEVNALLAEANPARMRKAKAGNNGGDNKNSTPAKNSKKICNFYKPGEASSCKFGDKCNRTHIQSVEVYKEHKALREQLAKFNESILK